MAPPRAHHDGERATAHAATHDASHAARRRCSGHGCRSSTISSADRWTGARCRQTTLPSSPLARRQAAATLAPLGEVTGAQLLGTSERGGMQVAHVRLTVGSRTVNTLMYRRPDGIIEQYLLW